MQRDEQPDAHEGVVMRQNGDLRITMEKLRGVKTMVYKLYVYKCIQFSHSNTDWLRKKIGVFAGEVVKVL